MQISFGFLCFVLVGVMAAATAAFHIDMDGMYGQDLADQYALGLRIHLKSANYLDALGEQEQLDGADEDTEGEGKGKGKGKGKGRGKGKGKGGEGGEGSDEGEGGGKGKGKGKGRGKGKGKGNGGEGGGAATEAAFEAMLD